MGYGHSRRRGFTLIETLVALVIMTAMLLALSEGIARGWRGIAAAQNEARALALAQRLLTEAGITSPLEPGLQDGTTADGLSWQIDVRDHDGPQPASFGSLGAGARTPQAPRSSWVRVTVSTPSTGQPARTVTLTTLKSSRRE